MKLSDEKIKEQMMSFYNYAFSNIDISLEHKDIEVQFGFIDEALYYFDLGDSFCEILKLKDQRDTFKKANQELKKRYDNLKKAYDEKWGEVAVLQEKVKQLEASNSTLRTERLIYEDMLRDK